MRLLSVILFFVAVLPAAAQVLVVRDAVNKKRLPDVVVYSSSHSEITSLAGEVPLTGFSIGDTLFFQHPAYYTSFLVLPAVDSDIEQLLTEKKIKLDEVVVSVSRWAEPAGEFPNKVVGVTTNDIDFLNPPTTADALFNTGAIMVQKSQQGGGSPMMRGFAANRLLLVVDGIRMNNAIYRSGNLQNIISVDANSLERVEALFGPGSVQYGSDALGGVINMTTLPARFADEPLIEGSGLLRYASAANEFTAHFDLSYLASRFASVTSLSFSRYGDLRMGSQGPDEYLRKHYASTVNGVDIMVLNEEPRLQRPSGYQQYSFLQKLRFKNSTYTDTELSLYYSNTGNIPRYDRLIQYADNDTLKYSNWYYGPQEWLFAKMEVNYNRPASWYDKARLQLAYQQARESRHDRKFGSAIRRNRYEQVDVVAVNIDLTKALNDRHHLYYGLNTQFNRVSSTANTLDIITNNKMPAPTRYPDGAVYNSLAAYVTYEYKASEQVNFLAGVRYSQFFLRAAFDTTFYDFPFNEVNLTPGAPSASVGVVWQAGSHTTWRANLSSAFRAPNVDDVGKVFDSEPGLVIVPNPDLQPEYAYNLDLALVQQLGNWLRLDITGFYTYLDNAMVRDDFQFNGQDSIYYDGELSKVQALVNTASARIYGLNLLVDADIMESLSLSSSFNITYGQDNRGLALRHVTPAFGTTHLIYKNHGLKLDLYTNYSAGYAYEQLAPEEQNKPHLYAKDANGKPYFPSWFTLNFSSSMLIGRFIQFNLGLENLLDARYKTYSSGLVAPGFNIKAGLRAYF